jgi:hypothetical protein
LRRVAYDGGVVSILQFQLKRGGDGTKRCRRMKQRQRTHLDLIGRKRDTVRRRDDIDRRKGGTGEGKGRSDTSWADANCTRPKNE